MFKPICAGCVPFVPGRPHRCGGTFATLVGGPHSTNEGLRTVNCVCAEGACADRQLLLRALKGVA